MRTRLRQGLTAALQARDESAVAALRSAIEQAILLAEVQERRASADDYERRGRQDQAVRLRREAGVLTVYLRAPPAPRTED